MDYIDLSNPKSMQKIREWAEAEAKKTIEYKRLVSRSFKNHSKYPHYKEIALDLAVHLI